MDIEQKYAFLERQYTNALWRKLLKDTRTLLTTQVNDFAFLRDEMSRELHRNSEAALGLHGHAVPPVQLSLPLGVVA